MQYMQIQGFEGPIGKRRETKIILLLGFQAKIPADLTVLLEIFKMAAMCTLCIIRKGIYFFSTKMYNVRSLCFKSMHIALQGYDISIYVDASPVKILFKI